MNSGLRALLFFWALALTLPLFGAEVSIPGLSGPVVDAAKVLSPSTQEVLGRELRRLHDGGGSQLVVLTVPSLEGEAIEQFSIRVAERWKLGSQDKDNGVILILSVQDRKLRIEVGQGLEGQLTDAYSSRIIRNTIVPLLQEGRFDAGVVAGVSAILSYTDPDFAFGGGAPQAQRRAVRGGGGLHLFVFLLLLVLFIISRVFGGHSVSSRYRGRGPWDGGFGGGFGGGGGGFSGGGSSGQW